MYLKNATVYRVVHKYDVDGGFGDAISKEETVRIFSNKADAEAFVKQYSNEHVYDRPYAALSCGLLEVEEEQLMPSLEKAKELAMESWWYN